MANRWEALFTPDAWVPPSSSHADRGVVQGRLYLAFDDTAVETMRSREIIVPAAYNGGTVKADVYYMMASATSGKVDFEVSIEAVSDGDALDLDAAESFDSVNAGNATVPGTAGHPDVITITLTNKDSMAAGDLLRLKLERDSDDATDDTATGDARVLAVRLYEEV